MRDKWSREPIFEIYNSVNFGASRADIWRLCILFDRGGGYLDIDSTLNFSLDEIDPTFSELISFEGSRVKDAFHPDLFPDLELFQNPELTNLKYLKFPENVALNWALFFSPGHQILRIAIDEIVEKSKFIKGHVFEDIGVAVVHTTGPIIFTHAIWRYLKESPTPINQMGLDFDGLGVFKAIGRNSSYHAAGHYSMATARAVIS